MRWEEQAAERAGRYVVIPRALCFITYGTEVLLLRGAPGKRIWSGKWNGIGGHIECDETVLDGIQREILEETGLEVDRLNLRAIVHVCGKPAGEGVLFFVYVAEARSREVRVSSEGDLAWFPVDALPQSDLVEDLPELIPRVLLSRVRDHMVYGRYYADARGQVVFEFSEG